MNNLKLRTVTGLVLVVIILMAVSVSVYSFISLMVTINILALLEFYRLVHVERKLTGTLCPTALIHYWGLLHLYLVI